MRTNQRLELIRVKQHKSILQLRQRRRGRRSVDRERVSWIRLLLPIAVSYLHPHIFENQQSKGARYKFKIMAKDYKNDKRSKSNKTKWQAQQNAQDIQSMWRKRASKPSATGNERSSRTSTAVAASTLGGAGVREVSAPVQNTTQADEFASVSNNEATARNRPSPNSCAPPLL